MLAMRCTGIGQSKQARDKQVADLHPCLLGILIISSTDQEFLILTNFPEFGIPIQFDFLLVHVGIPTGADCVRFKPEDIQKELFSQASDLLLTTLQSTSVDLSQCNICC